MRSQDLEVDLYVPSSDRDGRRSFTHDAVPPWLKAGCYRLNRSGAVAMLALRRQFRRALKRADVAYIWAATPEAFYLDVKSSGLPPFVERMNCHRATSVPILDEAYRRAGLPPAHGISAASLLEERRKLALADWIFAPSPLVVKSLLDEGHPPEKVLATSYGWSPERMTAERNRAEVDVRPRILFVGTLNIRKGAHLLLNRWAAAEIDGCLDLCGQVTDEIRRVAGQHLQRPDVKFHGHVPNIAQAYADSDVFAFPTFEEGGPLVTYEAAAHGLGIVTTPMGAGAIIRDGVEGLVRHPYDDEGWIQALRRLAANRELRSRLGTAARVRAQAFTWSKVGGARRELVVQALGRQRF
jgi:glycosyltransferase involved in cell wall biosynthesis